MAEELTESQTVLTGEHPNVNLECEGNFPRGLLVFSANATSVQLAFRVLFIFPLGS